MPLNIREIKAVKDTSIIVNIFSLSSRIVYGMLLDCLLHSYILIMLRAGFSVATMACMFSGVPLSRLWTGLMMSAKMGVRFSAIAVDSDSKRTN
jgi:hypothetical protein